MNRNILFVLALSGVMVGCTTPGLLSLASCDVYGGPVPPCEGNPNTPAVGVHITANDIVVTPRCVKAARTKTIVFNVTPPGQTKVGSVAIVPKNTTDSWLTGTNSPDKKEIKILVPDWVTSGEYQYGILTSSGKCIDPRVSVE